MAKKNRQKKYQNSNGGHIEDSSNVIFDPMSVTWLEKYDKIVSRIWNKVPTSVGKVIATVATFLVGISINGDWVNLFVHLRKQLGYATGRSLSETSIMWNSISIENLRLTNFSFYFISSCVVSYTMYFGVGGFLHWYYYVRQRDRPYEWKCQPTKWLSPELERHEIILGTFSLTLNMTVSAILATYIANGGYCTVYYQISDYGWFWFLLQFPIIYIILDYITYWIHRIYHFPWLYVRFHKLHHKYKQPTAFSVTAIHPVESLNIQLLLITPLFTIPVHWLSYYTVVIYNYYHGIIDHSGVNFKAYWWQPWQPDAIFHDNHHQYCHVNFGFNLSIWDKLHGTFRLKDRVYREDIFFGNGKAIQEVSEAELLEDIKERQSENPLAYKNNKLDYELSPAQIKRLKSKK
ncbi:uncharacterized protein LOC130898155 [Diorhabda carinulata]|uniref:uncharacterized protein LOC130898155 n=1 Tax=Diorhabda carinulata TaxID=1163345 RepID=UPI0025A22FC4|nr:uncharacterized protein LOC130898155 [Diorhabda carinulata]